MAGRIAQHFIDDLLDRSDIVDIVSSRVPLKKTGKNFSACCPFHQEKTPSFSVSPDKQFYYCFGCGAGGNAISFVMDFERLDFIEAVEQIARHAGLEIVREESQNAAPYENHRALYELMERCSQFYQQQLRHHSQRDVAVNYLKNRGLSGQIAKLYQLGFNPTGWNNLTEGLASDDKEQIGRAHV